MAQKVGRFIYWTPRILSILFILFLAMFSLDIFGNNYTWWEVIIGLFMHNIPVFVLIAVLVIAWKYEWVGGVAFILAGSLYVGMILFNSINNGFEWYYLAWAIQIAGPAFLVGALFFVNWFRKGKKDAKKKKIKKKR